MRYVLLPKQYKPLIFQSKLCYHWGMKKNLHISLNVFIFIISAVFVFKSLSPFYHSFVVRSDTLTGTFAGLLMPFTNFLTCSDHSWIVMSLFWRITARLIPEFLGIHPQVWFCQYYYWFLFGMMILLLSSIWSNFTKYFKNKNYSSLWIFLIIPILFGFIQKSDAACFLHDDCWSYAYFFLPCFFIVFFSELEKFYIKNDFHNCSKTHKVVLFLLLLCVGVSHEFSRFVLCASVFFCYLLNTIFINKNINHKKFWQFYSLIVVSNTFLFFSPCFQNWYLDRQNSFSEILNKISGFFVSYCKYILLDNFLLLLLIVSFLVFILVKVHQKKIDDEKQFESKRLCVFALSATISVLLFPLLTMIGDEYGFPSCEHRGVRLLTSIFLLNIFLSELGWFIAESKNIVCKISIIFICFASLIFQNKYQCFGNYIDEFKYSLNLKKRVYILERIFEEYGRKNKVFLYTEGDCTPTSIVYFLYLYDRNSEQNEYKNINACENIDFFDYEKCNKKLLNFYNQKTGRTITEDDLNELDFQKHYKF